MTSSKSTAGPAFVREATALANVCAREYRGSIEEIAQGLARYEGTGRVFEKHIREAVAIVEFAGRNRKPWYARPEIEIGFGTACFGWACCVPDFLGGFLPDDSVWKRSAVPLAMSLLIATSIVCVSHGMLRSRGAA